MSTLLSEKIDDQEQYSRRSYLIFEGLNDVDENKNLSQDIVNIVRNELNAYRRWYWQKPPNKKIEENI